MNGLFKELIRNMFDKIMKITKPTFWLSTQSKNKNEQLAIEN